MVTRSVTAAVLVVLAALAISSCGKRGNLVWPEGSTYPRQYPPPDEKK